LLPDLVPQPPERSPHLPRDAAQEKHQLIAAFTQFFLRQAAGHPVLVIVEDLHWSDDSSLECLYYLARSCPRTRWSCS
jgi:predicted ATPase